MSRWQTALLAAAASISLAASGPQQVDATRLSCAQFAELPQKQQMRILSFLQGYAHRDVADDKVGSVPVGAGLQRVLGSCKGAPSALVFEKVREVASASTSDPGEARMARFPTEISCREYKRLSREDRRYTVFWLDGFSRKADPADAQQGVVDLSRDAENFASIACGKKQRQQRLWWAVQGGVRSAP